MLKKDKAALVIVDVQGKLATLMYEKDRLFANLVRMAEGAKALDIPILWNVQLPDKLGPTIPELTEALTGMEPMSKNTFSCCGNSEFSSKLKATGCSQVLLVGIETHVCVYQTAIDLLRDGFEVHLVVDAVSSRLEHNYHLAVQKIKDLGAQLTSVEMCLFEMLGVAEGDAFKKIIKIVK
jgi:nicotinamidase-related amidase